MLYTIESNGNLKQLDYIPHKDHYDHWMNNLLSSPNGQAKLDAVLDDLNRRIDSSEIETSSWMPGNDWTGTVFHPLYEDACKFDEEQSGLFFGLLVWCVFKDRPDAWSFGRYALNDIPIRGLTYFRITP